jgi:two-component system, oxyanion-binding sensor
VLALRAHWADENPDTVAKLLRALDHSAAFIEDPANHGEAAALLSAPHRVGVAADVIERTLEGRLKIAPDGSVRTDKRYLLIGHNGAARPDPVQAAWLYAQMVRWGQAPLSEELLAAAKNVFRPDLFDAALQNNGSNAAAPADGVGAFSGPTFDAEDITGHLKFWAIKPR